jgi:hypothetical protein
MGANEYTKMALTRDSEDLALGIGAGVLSFLLGLALIAVVVFGDVDVLEHPAVVGGIVGVIVAYGIAGLYEVVARGVPRRGVADLCVSAGLILTLLAPHGDPSRGFVATGAVALLAAAVYHGALAADLIAVDEDRAVGVESDEA